MKALCSISCLLFLLTFSNRAFAAYMELTEPTVAFPQGFPDSAKTNIFARLRRADCKFLGGSALNSSTSLRYSGDTIPLNLFMEGLATCPGLTLSVRFYEGPDDSSDWHVTHIAHQPTQFVVRINLKSSRIKLDKLVIPDIKAPSSLKPETQK